MTAGRVVVADLESWQSLLDLAAGLRERGFHVVRYTRRPERMQQRARVALEGVIFDSTREVLHAAPDGSIDLAGLPQQLPTVLDVQAVDRVGARLLATRQWQQQGRLHRVHAAGLDDTVIYDKLRYSRVAQEAGVVIPDTVEGTQAPPADTRLVVKVRVGSGGDGVALVDRADEIPSVLAAFNVQPDDVLVQRQVDGDLWNVGGVAFQGRVLTMTSYRVYAPASDPAGPPCMVQIERNPPVLTAAAQVVSALGYTGPFAADFIVGSDVYFLDFNPRIFGGWAAVQAAGVDLLGAYVSVLEGDPTVTDSGPASSELLPCAFGGGDGLRGRLRHNGQVRAVASPVLGSRWRFVSGIQALALARRE